MTIRGVLDLARSKVFGIDLDLLIAKRKMPKTKKEWWYCGEWYMYRSDENDAGRPYKMNSEPLIPEPPYEGKFMLNPFSNILDRAWKSDPKPIACIKIDGYIGWYTFPKRYRTTSFYDGASWDDGYHVDLTLVEVTRE